MNMMLRASLVLFAVALALACALGFAPNDFAWYEMAVCSALAAIFSCVALIDGIIDL